MVNYKCVTKDNDQFYDALEYKNQANKYHSAAIFDFCGESMKYKMMKPFIILAWMYNCLYNCGDVESLITILWWTFFMWPQNILYICLGNKNKFDGRN